MMMLTNLDYKCLNNCIPVCACNVACTASESHAVILSIIVYRQLLSTPADAVEKFLRVAQSFYH